MRRLVYLRGGAIEALDFVSIEHGAAKPNRIGYLTKRSRSRSRCRDGSNYHRLITTFWRATSQLTVEHWDRSCRFNGGVNIWKFQGQTAIGGWKGSSGFQRRLDWNMHSTELGSRYANTTGLGPGTQGYIVL